MPRRRRQVRVVEHPPAAWVEAWLVDFSAVPDEHHYAICIRAREADGRISAMDMGVGPTLSGTQRYLFDYSVFTDAFFDELGTPI